LAYYLAIERVRDEVVDRLVGENEDKDYDGDDSEIYTPLSLEVLVPPLGTYLRTCLALVFIYR